MDAKDAAGNMQASWLALCVCVLCCPKLAYDQTQIPCHHWRPAPAAQSAEGMASTILEYLTKNGYLPAAASSS